MTVSQINRAVVLYDVETFEERQVQCCKCSTCFVGVRLLVTQGVLLSIARDVSVLFSNNYHADLVLSCP